MSHGIKQLRRSRKWTQVELGKRADIGQHRISLLERGLEPKPKELERLKKAFGFSVTERLHDGQNT